MKKMNITYMICTLVCTLIISSCVQQDTKTQVNSLEGLESCGPDTKNDSKQKGVFVLDGKVITKSDLPADVKEMIYKTEYEAYSKNLMVYKQYALRFYLAKKQNKLKDPTNPPQIIDLIDRPKIKAEEVKSFYEQNKNRMPPNSDFSKMRNQLVQYLEKQKMGELFQKKLAEMEGEKVFKSLILEPMAQKVVIDTTGYPMKGNKNAKIQIIEVSDYLCGHCIKAHPEVKKIMNKYKDQVNLTQINFSLRPPGISGTYVRGGHCAQKQGVEKFWKYHDETFKSTSLPHQHKDGDVHTDNDGNSKESIQKVKNVASKAGLDMKKFSNCLNSPEAHAFVKNAAQLVQSKGINSTPVFIVNSKKLARGVYELEQAIKNNM